jgi:hypothetical protein
MTLIYTVELPESTKLTTHCPDFHTLNQKIQHGIFQAVVVNTTAPEMPRVTRIDDGEICERCCAPLLPSGACSSRNCPVGRQPYRKPTAGQLARTIPGVKLGSKLKK